MHLRRHGNLERTIMATPIPASSILDALPSEVSRGLFAHGRSISLEAEQTLFLAGDEGDGCYRVEDGLLKASVSAPNGGERILAILGRTRRRHDGGIGCDRRRQCRPLRTTQPRRR